MKLRTKTDNFTAYRNDSLTVLGIENLDNWRLWTKNKRQDLERIVTALGYDVNILNGKECLDKRGRKNHFKMASFVRNLVKSHLVADFFTTEPLVKTQESKNSVVTFKRSWANWSKTFDVTNFSTEEERDSFRKGWQNALDREYQESFYNERKELEAEFGDLSWFYGKG